MAAELPEIVVFFDGVCGLCNHFIDFLIAHDSQRRLRYAPLQGEAYRTVCEENPALAGIDSVVVTHRRPDGTTQTLIRSRGALFALAQLGGGWQILMDALAWVPTPLLDVGYRLIAKTRYLIFGKHAACRLPSAAERTLFLP